MMLKAIWCVLALSAICATTWSEEIEEDSKLQIRVVNGKNAGKHEWPWQIFITRDGRFICGGSIIKKNWILTAAHCVQPQPQAHRYRVTVGGHARLGKKTAHQKTFRVKKVLYHHHYFRKHLRYDVALLELDGYVTLSKGVKIVTLPRKNSRVTIGKKCFVTGWGRLQGGGRLPSILQEAHVHIAPFRLCYLKNFKMVHDPSMVCAGGRGRGACNGDSGGPLSCLENGRWVLRGVTSWGARGCKVSQHYSVFARVSSVIDWINKNTEPERPCKNLPCRFGKTRCFGPANVYSFCKCSSGYKGQFCEIRETRCPNRPCYNGGRRACNGVVASCNCSSSYTGDYCEWRKGWDQGVKVGALLF